jgi:uncharacterized membrane protein
MKGDTRGAGRLAFLDWVRGLAAVTMLNGHAFHSFTRANLREDGPYVITQFIGGIPPAIFLFLVGVTLSFLMDSCERKQLPARTRVWKALRRAGYLFMLAFLFRIQLWVFGLPSSPWTDLFRVDVLNCMGFAVAVLSIMAVFSTADRVRLCAALGLTIAGLSPLVSQFDWSGVPVIVKTYIAPDYLAFGFFPWAAFVAFGMSAGSIIRLLPADRLERAAQWGALLGFGLILGGEYASSFPYSVYPKSEYWLNSPWLILSKTGVVLLILSFAYAWTRHSEGRWSWVRQFGLTSLLVYWVHIELVYGRWFWFWKENLTATQVTACSVVLILLMLLLSLARTQWRNWARLGFSMGWYFFTERRTPAMSFSPAGRF